MKKTKYQIHGNTMDETERNYIGHYVEFLAEKKGEIRGLVNKINVSKKGVKIGNRWYSGRRLFPFRRKGEVEIYEEDPILGEPYLQINYAS